MMTSELRLGMLRLLAAGAGPRNRPLVHAFRSATHLRLTGEDPEGFRTELAGLLGAYPLAEARRDVCFDQVSQLLARGKGYKRTIFGRRWAPSAGNTAFRWLTHQAATVDITTDVMRLPAGQHIPPHGHRGVVSAIYLLSGSAWVRTWDTIGNPSNETVLLRPQLNARLIDGDLTTSSEEHHNLHWLLGEAPLTWLLRFTISDVRSAKGERFGREGARCYIDPTGSPDAATGLVSGRRVSGEVASALS